MITQQKSSSNQKMSRASIVLLVFGIALNLIAVFSNGKAALVAVGCSLIVIAFATSSRGKKS